MGQVKKLMMEYDELLSNVQDFRGFVRDISDINEHRQIVDHIVQVTHEIEELLFRCRNKYSRNAISYADYTISRCKELIGENPSYDNLEQILHTLTKCRFLLYNEAGNYEPISLNSSEYYENEIRSLNERLSNLTQELDEQTSMHAEEVSLKESEKRELLEQIAQFRKKEEQVKQRDDAKAIWKKGIEESFKILDNDIQPIKEEKQRLRNLYWAYCILSVLMLGILVAAEVIAIIKLNDYLGIPPFRIYLSLIAPIPIALALLFVFMTQINRAQRQMVSISKYIHDIKYIEGILLAINNLSVDIDDSMKRINAALDKLLERHLISDKEHLREEDLKILEKKDSIPLAQVYELLSVFMGRGEKKG